jgi:acyl-CoA synthetase (AMP-forming)/AMP-acid ligase II/aryl carrier-like protein
MIGKSLPHIKSKVFCNKKNAYTQTVGDIGELCLSGPSISKGYLNDSVQTNKHFIQDRDNDSIFKTGDLVKIHQNGNYEYIGRLDHRMKIRGYRVDPLEIETALISHDEIQDAFAISTGNQSISDKLIAFVKIKKQIEPSNIKAYLNDILPEYMIPNEIIQKTRFPLTSNGKIDTKQLLFELKTKKNIPQDNAFIKIWETVLGKKIVDKNMNFFDMGGDSLLLLKLHHELENKLNCKITLMDLIAHPSVAEFERFLENAKNN